MSKEAHAKDHKDHHSKDRFRPKHSYLGFTKNRGAASKQGGGAHSWGQVGAEQDQAPLDPRDPDFDDTPETVYRLVLEDDWKAAQAKGSYEGSKLDKDSRYIHLATHYQVKQTAAIFFKGVQNLFLVEYDTKALGRNMRWESVVERDNDLFPHLYEVSLPTSGPAVLRVIPLPLNGEAHVFPSEFEEQ